MKRRKNYKKVLLVLTFLGALLGIIEIILPVIKDSSQSLSGVRLQKAGDPHKTAMVVGLLKHNVGIAYYIVCLSAGAICLRIALGRLAVFSWCFVVGSIGVISLVFYLVYLDYPRPSPRADLVSEIMILSTFCFLFPVYNRYLGNAVLHKHFDHKFWFIGGAYLGVYLFLCPALIGDVITIIYL